MAQLVKLIASTAEPLNCTAQFYYDVTTHTCRPSCDWKMNNVGTIVSPVAIATSIPSTSLLALLFRGTQCKLL